MQILSFPLFQSVTRPALFCLRLFIVPLGALFFLAGCTTSATRFDVEVAQAYELPANSRAYHLVWAGAGNLPGDLEASEIRQGVKNALASMGLHEASAGTPADMSIEVSFGMEAPRRRLVAKADPLSQPPPWPTNTTLYLDPESDAPAALRDAQGYALTLSTEVIYKKYLHLSARETAQAAGARPPREFWSIEVGNSDRSDALDAYVPLMVAAALDSIPPAAVAGGTFGPDTLSRRVVLMKTGR